MNDTTQLFTDPRVAGLAAPLFNEYFGKQTLNSHQLIKMADRYFDGALSRGSVSRTEMYDIVQLITNGWIWQQATALGKFNPTHHAQLAQNYNELDALVSNLPTHTQRDFGKVDYQQFSTPPAYGLMAAWAAHLQPTDAVLEPSAGCGGLAVFAQPWASSTMVNEIENDRFNLINQLPFWDSITGIDAGKLHLYEHLPFALMGGNRPTVVMMNPPFTKDQGRDDVMVCARHIESALRVLRNGGRLVAIVSGGIDYENRGKPGASDSETGMGMKAATYAQWWKKIQQSYTVRCNVGINGSVYAKYGTTIRTRLVVIDKVGPQPLTVPTITKVNGNFFADEPIELMQDQALCAALFTTRVKTITEEFEAYVGDLMRESSRNSAQSKGAALLQRGGIVPKTEEEPAYSEPSDTATLLGAMIEELNRPAAEPRTEAETMAVEVEALAVDSLDEQQDAMDVFHGYTAYARVEKAKPHNVTLVESNTMRNTKLPIATAPIHLPLEAVEIGHISEVQVESAIYAAHSNNQFLKDGITRKAFLIGHGTGVGKGTTAATCIMHWDLLFKQQKRSRVKALWLTKEFSLSKDAIRDWMFIGGDHQFIFTQDKIKEQKLTRESGIMVSTYSTFSKRGIAEKADSIDRLQQIIDWAPDVIIFDESHLMGNAVSTSGARGTTGASQRALAGMKLQEELPDARVIYFSATAATEVHNLGYAAHRLGLCGPGTAFPDLHDFIGKIKKSGMLGMELVAKDMKAMGLYHACNLSYDGTSFEMLQHNLTDEQTQLYDEACYFWRMVYDFMQQGFAMNDTSGAGKAMAVGQFWGAAQRFYNQILISMQAPTAINYMLEKLREGHSVVVQLVNTNEAATERVVADALSKNMSLDDLDITPRDSLMQYVETCFPTVMYTEETDDNGNKVKERVVDEHGNNVHNPEAVALKQELLFRLAEMRVPEGALDMVLQRLDKEGFPAAEITGRSRRFLKKTDESGQEHRVQETRSKSMGDAEAAEFMADERKALIFSGAGNTGRSFHSDKKSKNQRRRFHIVLQPGWRADEAIQGMGRTHRTNQANAPHYVLVTTDLPGQKRFVTSIARRIEQLGSLTKGNRKAANSGLFKDTDNLETTWAYLAIKTMFMSLFAGSADYMEALQGNGFEEVCDLMGFNLLNKDGGIDTKKIPPVTQFLNRVLFLPTSLQRSVFALFERIHAETVESAAQNGLLDRGVEKIDAESIEKIEEKLVYADKETGARTSIVTLECTHLVRHTEFRETQMHGKYVADNIEGYSYNHGDLIQYVKNTLSGKVYGVFKSGNATTDGGAVVPMVRLISPFGATREKLQDLGKMRTIAVDNRTAEIMWRAEIAASQATRKETVYLVTGAVLPVWDKLDKSAVRIMVANTTDTNERILGRNIPADQLDTVLSNLGMTSTGIALTTGEIMKRILNDNAKIFLSNNWMLQRMTFPGGDTRITLWGPTLRSQVADIPNLKFELSGLKFYSVLVHPGDALGYQAVLQEVFDRHSAARIQYQSGKVENIIDKEAEQLLQLAEQIVDVEAYTFDSMVTYHEGLLPLRDEEQMRKLIDALDEATEKGTLFSAVPDELEQVPEKKAAAPAARVVPQVEYAQVQAAPAPAEVLATTGPVKILSPLEVAMQIMQKRNASKGKKAVHNPQQVSMF